MSKKSGKALNEAIGNLARPQVAIVESEQPSSSLAPFVFTPETPKEVKSLKGKRRSHLHQVYFDTELTNRIERYLYEEKLKGKRLFKTKLFEIAVDAFLNNLGY